MVAAELESEVMELEVGTTFCCCPTRSRRPRVRPVPAVRGGWEEEEEEGDAIMLLKESVEMPVVKGQKSAVQSWVEGLASMVLVVVCLCVCAGCLSLVSCVWVNAWGGWPLLACCSLTPPRSHTLTLKVQRKTKLGRQTRRPCVSVVFVCVYVCVWRKGHES
jgi:hypothetical protein